MVNERTVVGASPSAKAAAVTPFALLVPIAGLGSAALILGEQLTLIEVAAGLVILLGLAIALVTRGRSERVADRPLG